MPAIRAAAARISSIVTSLIDLEFTLWPVSDLALLAVSGFTPQTSPCCCRGPALNSIADQTRPLRFGAKNKSAAAEAAALVGLSQALEEKLGGELHIPRAVE
jgi:hypothetical protein